MELQYIKNLEEKKDLENKQRIDKLKQSQKKLEHSWKMNEKELNEIEANKRKSILEEYIWPKILDTYNWNRFADNVLEWSCGEASQESANEYVVSQFESFLKESDYQLICELWSHYKSEAKDYIKNIYFK